MSSRHKQPTIIGATRDANLFAPWFRKRESWSAWFTFLKVLFGLEMDEAERRVFQECTGRTDAPQGGFNESWLIVGRRGGKSLMLSLIAVFLATMRDWSPYLAPGERGTIMIIATDRRQARTIFRYVRSLLRDVAMLAPLIERETADALDLSNNVTIEIQTASFRTVRGYTLVAALCDEAAFWRSDESANPDSEIIAALRPAMGTIPGAMLLVASSPYARRGELWNAFRQHYGKDDSSALVWKAATRIMNPSVPQAVIDAAMEADPASAAAEYGAEFRTDVETYISREVVDAAVVIGRRELPRIDNATYRAFVDPSGGSSDSMTLAIARMDGTRVVLDLVRERKPPFSPDDVPREFADVLKSYKVASVRGDRYGGEWPRERFRTHGIDYMTATIVKNDLYRELLPILRRPVRIARASPPDRATVQPRASHRSRRPRQYRSSAGRARRRCKLCRWCNRDCLTRGNAGDAVCRAIRRQKAAQHPRSAVVVAELGRALPGTVSNGPANSGLPGHFAETA